MIHAIRCWFQDPQGDSGDVDWESGRKIEEIEPSIFRAEFPLGVWESSIEFFPVANEKAARCDSIEEARLAINNPDDFDWQEIVEGFVEFRL